MAAAFVAGLLLLFSIVGHSEGAYCVCNTGLSDTVLQKNIDYACGAGADCSAIIQSGACYNPNTVRDHCNYAVNSYYQRKGNIPGSCDFQGTAAVTQTPPNAPSGCVYQSSPSRILSSGGGSTTPTTGGTPGAGSTTTVPGSTGIGLGPTGSGFSDNNSGVRVVSESSNLVVLICGVILGMNLARM